MRIKVTQTVASMSDSDDRAAYPASIHGLGSFSYYRVPARMTAEAALDWFHNNVPIGCLDDFLIEVEEDVDYEAELEKALIGVKKEDYIELRDALCEFPMTWYPDLIRAMVTAAIEKRVFLPGKVHVFVQKVEESLSG